MFKHFSIIIVFLVISIFANSQITEGNWLVGGTANFYGTNNDYTSELLTMKSTSSNFKISPTIGYFFVDKLVGGIKLSLGYDKSKGGDNVSGAGGSGGHSEKTDFDFGPFVRYYFLPQENRINVFTDASYQYGVSNFHPGNGNRNVFSINAGPVVYLNSSIGLEFTIGYYSKNEKSQGIFSSKTKSFQAGIGFQIHLEK